MTAPYAGTWHTLVTKGQRYLVLIKDGSTVERIPTTLGPRGAHKECQRRNQTTTTL